jgi:transposase
MSFVAGIDVHSKTCSFCIQKQSSDEVVAAGEFETSRQAIAAFAYQYELPAGTRVGLETGTTSVFVARELTRVGLAPIIIDAREVRAKARRTRQKNDARDAFEICDGVRRDIYVRTVSVPDADTQRLRELLALRMHFVRVRSREVHTLKSGLRKRGLGRLAVRLRNEKAFTTLAQMPQIDSDLRLQIEAHRRMFVASDQEVNAIDKRLDELCEQFATTLGCVTSVPGVGKIVGLTCLAYYDNPHRFSCSKHAASYAGLVPTTYHSADRERFGHITKEGPKPLRSMLVEAAQHARRRDHPLHEQYIRLALRKGHNIAIVATAHRLARICWALLRDQKMFDARRYAGPIQGHGCTRTQRVPA